MNENNISRSNKRKKRRHINRMIYFLFILAFLLLIMLIFLLVTNNSSSTETSQSDVEKSDIEQEDVQKEKQEKSITTNQINEETEKNEDDEQQLEKIEEDNSFFVEYVEPSDDNVVVAYISHWQPIGTDQEDPHKIDNSEGSVDYKEMMEAIHQVTELEKSNIIEWAIEQESDDTVITTVSDQDEERIFRVYLSWITNEGWQVTKVEELYENDKK